MRKVTISRPNKNDRAVIAIATEIRAILLSLPPELRRALMTAERKHNAVSVAADALKRAIAWEIACDALSLSGKR